MRINNRSSEKLEVRKELRQGDPLSSLLFSLLLEKVIQEAEINRCGIQKKTSMPPIRGWSGIVSKK